MIRTKLILGVALAMVSLQLNALKFIDVQWKLEVSGYFVMRSGNMTSSGFPFHTCLLPDETVELFVFRSAKSANKVFKANSGLATLLRNWTRRADFKISVKDLAKKSGLHVHELDGKTLKVGKDRHNKLCITVC